MSSLAILKSLFSNHNLSGIESENIRTRSSLPAPVLVPEVEAPEVKAPRLKPPRSPAAPRQVKFRKKCSGPPRDVVREGEEVLDEGVMAYMSEHANEIAAEADHGYQPIGGIHEEFSGSRASRWRRHAAAATASSGGGAGAAAKKAPSKKSQLAPKEERGSALQKIAKLDIKGRIQLAMKRHEGRALAADPRRHQDRRAGRPGIAQGQRWRSGEICQPEECAGSRASRHPDEATLRQELRGRAQPGVQPAHPVGLSLTLMKNMLVGDLRNLSGNKEDLRHSPQAGHKDVQAKDREQQQALTTNRFVIPKRGLIARGICFFGSATDSSPINRFGMTIVKSSGPRKSPATDSRVSTGFPDSRRTTISCMASLPESDPITDLLKRSQTIAVVGLSNSPMRPSHGVSAYMQSHGYRIIPVNPKIRGSLGEKAYGPWLRCRKKLMSSISFGGPSS